MTLSATEIEEMIKKKIPDAVIEIEDLRGDNNHYLRNYKIISIFWAIQN